MAKRNEKKAVVRRVTPSPLDCPAVEMSHAEAFKESYGSHTYRLKSGNVRSRETDEATQRAAVCIAACDGLPLQGLKDGAVWELIETARSVDRLLGGRLAQSDPEAVVVLDKVRRAMRRLGIR
jgi:hypothetical protein